MEQCLKCRLQKFCKELYGSTVGGEYNMPPCAAPKPAELATTTANAGSPELPQLEDVKREAFAEMSATYGMPATNSEIVSMVYGIIERQLRAGA